MVKLWTHPLFWFYTYWHGLYWWLKSFPETWYTSKHCKMQVTWKIKIKKLRNYFSFIEMTFTLQFKIYFNECKQIKSDVVSTQFLGILPWFAISRMMAKQWTLIKTTVGLLMLSYLSPAGLCIAIASRIWIFV